MTNNTSEILVVDDEKGVVNALVRTLWAKGRSISFLKRAVEWQSMYLDVYAPSAP